MLVQFTKLILLNPLAIIIYKGINRKFFNKVPGRKYARNLGFKARLAKKQHLIAHPICAICSKTSNLIVHHRKPVYLFPLEASNPLNLITLCNGPVVKTSCHYKIGHLSDWKDYNKNL